MVEVSEPTNVGLASTSDTKEASRFTELSFKESLSAPTAAQVICILMQGAAETDFASLIPMTMRISLQPW